MNIIIAGSGKVGTTLARRLSEEGYNLTLTLMGWRMYAKIAM